MRNLLRWLVLLMGTVASAALVSALPLEEVTLLTSGVGEFTHRGTVTGSGTLTIPVPQSQMDDVLRSLTIIDLDGGTVEVVRYPGGEDPARQLARYPVNLAGARRMHQILQQVRGTAVEITVAPQMDQPSRGGTTTVTGILTGADEHAVLVAVEPHGTFREIPLERVETLQFASREVQEEVSRALAALHTLGSARETRELSVLYQGSGTRRIEVRYLQEVPQWHVTYRAVLHSGSATALLQGWAHLDNTGNSDWDNVEVTLVSALPVTFRHTTWEPRMVQRPPFSGAAATARPSPPSAAMAPAPLMRSESDARAMELTAVPRGQAGELIAGMTFTFPEKISVRSGESVMIPLVNQSVPVRMLRSFNPRTDGTQPRVAFRLTNQTGIQLPPGPVTVYEGNRYVGDGAMPLLVPRGETTITYARHPDIRITSSSGSPDEQLASLTIVDGLLVSERRVRRTTTYTIASTSPDRLVVITHAVSPGWTLVEPRSGVERDGATAFITSRGTSLAVTEEQILEQRVALTRLPDEQIAQFVSNRLLDPSVRRALQNIQELQQTVAERQRARRTLEDQLETLTADQGRIATNMAQLDRNSTLYRRYVSDLTRMEDELRIVRDDLSRARRDENQAAAALREYLRTLGAP